MSVFDYCDDDFWYFLAIVKHQYSRFTAEMEMNLTEVEQANLCLAGVLLAFVLLTFLAYLLTDGRRFCIVPLLRLCCPTCKWVVDQDKLSNDEELLVYQEEMFHQGMGARRPKR